MYKYNAKVVNVVDGDTVDLVVDLGFHIQIKERFRLHGVNAPESRTKDKQEKKKGLQAKKFVIDRIDQKEVQVDIIKGTGKYGRYLAKIYYKIDNYWMCINDDLLSYGYAVPYFGGKR